MPGQLSFESDAQGKVTALVQHQGGLERRARRLDDAGVQRLEDALAQRIKSNRPLPGSEAALRHLLDGLRQGKSAYDLMSPRAALDFISSPAIAQVGTILARLGPVKILSFRGVDATGRDRYIAIFAHGQALLTVAAPSGDGRLDGFGYTPFFAHGPADAPSPGTEAMLRRLIQSLQDNRPDYDVLTPDLASAWRAQWNFRHAQVASFGALQSITFRQAAPQGWDVYDVRFANGHTEWRIAPLTADGKEEMAFFGAPPATGEQG